MSDTDSSLRADGYAGLRKAICVAASAYLAVNPESEEATGQEQARQARAREAARRSREAAMVAFDWERVSFDLSGFTWIAGEMADDDAELGDYDDFPGDSRTGKMMIEPRKDTNIVAGTDAALKVGLYLREHGPQSLQQLTEALPDITSVDYALFLLRSAGLVYNVRLGVYLAVYALCGQNVTPEMLPGYHETTTRNRDIRERSLRGERITQIARQYGILPRTARRVIEGQDDAMSVIVKMPHVVIMDASAEVIQERLNESTRAKKGTQRNSGVDSPGVGTPEYPRHPKKRAGNRPRSDAGHAYQSGSPDAPARQQHPALS